MCLVNESCLFNANSFFSQSTEKFNYWSRIMLSIYLGKMEEAVYYPPVYFDNRYEDEWITDKQSVEIIRDVDKSDVISSHLIESPVLGAYFSKGIIQGNSATGKTTLINMLR